MKLFSTIIFFSFLFFLGSETFSQDKTFKIGCIAFYNIENLFDTIDDSTINDEEFLPDGANRWNSKKYNEKIKNISEVIAQIGNEYISGGPAIIGLSEIENRSVLIDLINSPALKASGYDIVHFDGPDRRGVDVALLYQTKHFKVTGSYSARLTIPGKDDFFSRDQLVVSGLFDGEPLHLIVNHWPSRRGGEKRSAPLRNAAATLSKNLADSLIVLEPNAKIIIMGDLNDNPNDASLIKYLKAKPDTAGLTYGQLFNPMYKMFVKDGIGSLAYRDNWSLFDQMIISAPLVIGDRSTYKFLKIKVYNKPFLTQKEGAFAGYPFRSFVGNNYMGGYSDHFPVYMFLVREIIK